MRLSKHQRAADTDPAEKPPYGQKNRPSGDLKQSCSTASKTASDQTETDPHRDKPGSSTDRHSRRSPPRSPHAHAATAARPAPRRPAATARQPTASSRQHQHASQQDGPSKTPAAETLSGSADRQANRAPRANALRAAQGPSKHRHRPNRSPHERSDKRPRSQRAHEPIHPAPKNLFTNSQPRRRGIRPLRRLHSERLPATLNRGLLGFNQPTQIEPRRTDLAAVHNQKSDGNASVENFTNHDVPRPGRRDINANSGSTR